MALKTGGTLWAFGDNAAGQLGLGDKVDRAVPDTGRDQHPTGRRSPQ